MRIISFLTLVLVTICSYAQMVTIKEKPSFYLGQRGTLDISLLFQPSVAPMFAKDLNAREFRDKEDEKILPIYLLVNPQLEYTYAFNNNLAAYVRGGYAISSRAPSYEDYDDKLREYLSESGMSKITRNTIGFGLAVYFSGRAAIAPIGTNFSLGLSKHTVRATYEGLTAGKINYNTNKFEPYRDLNNNESMFEYSTLDWGFQAKELITSKVYLNYGISGSFKLNLQSGIGATNYDNDETYEMQQLNNTRASFAFRDLLILRIGAGMVIH